MTYGEHKQRVAEIVDATYAATLDGVPARPGRRQPAIVCRSAGGVGGALGAGPALLGARGLQITNVSPDLTVLARDGEYQMSFDAYPKSGVALLGASGPCATPESEAQRETPVKFKSVDRKNASP